MYETGLPYTLDPHTLETVGMDTFNGALTLKAFAAHFRLDMKQGVSCFIGMVLDSGSFMLKKFSQWRCWRTVPGSITYIIKNIVRGGDFSCAGGVRETNKQKKTTTTTNNNNTKKNQRHKHKILSKKVLSRVSHRAHDGNSISSLNCNRQTLNEY